MVLFLYILQKYGSSFSYVPKVHHGFYCAHFSEDHDRSMYSCRQVLYRLCKGNCGSMGTNFSYVPKVHHCFHCAHFSESHDCLMAL
jgi:hypothetical protein